jgi:hypothetical protein
MSKKILLSLIMVGLTIPVNAFETPVSFDNGREEGSLFCMAVWGGAKTQTEAWNQVFSNKKVYENIQLMNKMRENYGDEHKLVQAYDLGVAFSMLRCTKEMEKLINE